MVIYFSKTTFTSIRKNIISTIAMILIMSGGVGTSSTMLSVINQMSRNPVPDLSGNLFSVVIDARPTGWSNSIEQQNTFPDSSALLKAGVAEYQASIAPGKNLLEYKYGGIPNANFFYGQYATNEIFKLFGMNFISGESWSRADDDNRSRVIVLTKSLALQYFGKTSPVGQEIDVDGIVFRVVGVVKDWQPIPDFVSGLSGDYAFQSRMSYFIPISTAIDLKMKVLGGMSCWGEQSNRESGTCAWVHTWVRLKNEHDIKKYKSFLSAYVLNKSEMEGASTVNTPFLMSLDKYLSSLSLIPPDVSRELWVSQSFLFLCIFNVGALVLIKTIRASHHLSIRRALGASRVDVIIHVLNESLFIAILGSLFSMFASYFGMKAIKYSGDLHSNILHFDWRVAFISTVLTIIGMILASIGPAFYIAFKPISRTIKAL